MVTERGRPLQILLVEDNPGDVRLTEEVLREDKVLNTLHVVKDGVEAMAFLQREAPFERVPRPDLILLDLNLPKKDGREVLLEIKSDENLKTIPVVVLSVSRSEDDIANVYGHCGNCYIAKPVDFDQFVKVVRSIEDFWFTVAALPSSNQ